jgi:hypothetical protein
MKAKIAARALGRSGQQRVPISSFKSAKNDSAAALSKHDPVRPMLCRSPNRLISRRSSSEVYSLPRSECTMQPGWSRPRPAAMSSASTTREVCTVSGVTPELEAAVDD